MEPGGEKLTYRARLMQAVADIVYHYHRWVLAVIAAITVFMFISSRYIELKLNFTDMLSPDAPAVKNYKHAVEQFGALSFLFIVLETDGPKDLDTAKAYADELARRLPENPDYVPRVFYKVDLDDYLDDALLFAPERDLTMLADLAEKNRDAISTITAQPGLVSAIEGLDRALKSFTETGEVPELSEDEVDFGLVFDPLREMIGLFKDYAVNGPGGQEQKLKAAVLGSAFKSSRDLPLDLSESYILSKDKKRLLMFVTTTRPAEDFEWCREFMEYVEGVNAEVGKNYPGVKALMTGNAAFMRDDNKVIRHDMQLTTLVAFAGIMALFAFSFRNLSSIVMVGLPLVVGIIWSMGMAYWIIGHLTPVTAVFGAILLGLGIDYGILLLSRYTEERHHGRTIKEALDQAMTGPGVSIITGAIATAAAFFSMRLASFKAGQEMGIIAGVGIIMFVIIMTFGLGSLLVAWDRTREAVGPTQRRWDPRMMRRVAAVVDRGAVYVVMVLGAAVVFLAFHAPAFQFEYNYLNLEPEGIESFELVHKIPDPEWFNIDVNFGIVIAKSVDQDREIAEYLRGDTATVSRVEAVSDFIPTDQEQKLKQIARLDKALAGITPAPAAGNTAENGPAMAEPDFERLLTALKSLRETIGAPGRGLVGIFYVAELEEAEDGARALLTDLDGLIAALEEARGPKVYQNLGALDRRVAAGISDGWARLQSMTATKGVTIETMRAKHPELLQRFEGRDGSFAVYVFPSMTIFEEQNLNAVASGLRSSAAHFNTEAVGVALLFDEILRQIKRDLVRVATLALGMVFLVLLINYRGLWHTVLTLIPLVVGGIAMVGLMNLRGLKFNIVNTGMLPLLIGIGVDYGVYVVHRWISEGKGKNSIRPTVESTGRAVTLSALTTMIGFSAVILCKWRGLSMMGSTLSMGIALCWIAAVIFLPAVLKVIEIIRDRDPAGPKDAG